MRKCPHRGLISALKPNVGGKILVLECLAYSVVAQDQSSLERELPFHSAAAVNIIP